MSTSRSRKIAALLIPAGLALAACGGSAQGADTAGPPEVASVAESADGAPGVITLADTAERRLDIRTGPVAGGPGGLTVPYSAVVYEPDGSAWVFVRTGQLTYQRAAISISHITAEQATLASGPAPGTEVVTQGAAELVGVETGIDGEE